MDIRNCRKCGKIYTYDGFPTCRECRKAQEASFQKVKEYLHEFPGASVAEVESSTGVEAKEIMEFLRQGRLEMDPSSTITLSCERCGAKILTGRFCEKCSYEMESSFRGTYQQKVQQQQKTKSKEMGLSVIERRKKGI